MLSIVPSLDWASISSFSPLKSIIYYLSSRIIQGITPHSIFLLHLLRRHSRGSVFRNRVFVSVQWSSVHYLGPTRERVVKFALAIQLKDS